MGYKERARELIRRYGKAVEVLSEGNVRTSFAVIQPIRHKGKMYQGLEYSTAGAVDGGRYLYIGEGDKAFEKDAVTCIRDGDTDYYVEGSDLFMVRDETVYVRAILRICS